MVHFLNLAASAFPPSTMNNAEMITAAHSSNGDGNGWTVQPQWGNAETQFRAAQWTPRGMTKKSWNHHVRPTRRLACALIHVFVTSAFVFSFSTSESIPLSIVF